jgi:hypothetical protein
MVLNCPKLPQGRGGRKVRRGSLTDLPAATDSDPCSDAEKYMFIFSGNTQVRKTPSWPRSWVNSSSPS